MLTANELLFLFIYVILSCLPLNSTNVSSTATPSSHTSTASSVITTTTAATTTTASTTTTAATTTTVVTTTPVPRPSPPENLTRSVLRGEKEMFNCKIKDLTTQVHLLKDGDTIYVVDLKSGGNAIINKRKLTYHGRQTSLDIEMSNVTFSDTGLYICYTYGGDDSPVRGKSYNVTVHGTPVLFLEPPSLTYQLFTDQSLQISCYGVANPVADFVWTNNTSPVYNFTNLDVIFREAKNYTFTCVGRNSEGRSEKTVFVQVENSKPDAPIVTTTEIEQRSIQIAWKPGLKSGNSMLTHYLLRHKDGVLTLKNTSHTFSQLKPYTKYFFGLRACNAKTLCSIEVWTNVSTLEQERPSKPTELKVQSVRSHGVTVSFKHGEHRSSQVVFSCVNVFKLTKTSSCADLQDGLGCDRIPFQTTSHTFSNLTAFQSYVVFVVTCVDTKNITCAGDCKLTCSVCEKETFKTQSAVSSPATSLTVENTDSVNIEVKISWTPPVNLNSQHVQYKIKYSKNNGTVKIVNTKFSTNYTESSRVKRDNELPTYTQTLTNLSGSTPYYLTVSTLNENGESDAPWKFIETDEAVPSSVSNLKLDQAETYSLALSWLAPSSSPLVTAYRLNYTLQGAVFTKGKIVYKTLEVLSKLKEKSEYKISVEPRITRKRDKKHLFGKAQYGVFATVEASDDSTAALVVVTTVMVFVIIFVIIGAVLYCRRNGLCGLTYKSTFYTDEKEHAAFAFSLRQSLKTLESKHVPMTLSEFEKQLKDLHANSDYLFSEEYDSLGPHRPDRTCHHAHSEVNIQKNRYVDIAPYDQTRVRLMTLDGVPGSNYINANFVDGYHKTSAYIATQAPLTHTLSDFWRMIWENNCYSIVMLTNLVERGRKKCEQYWPSEGSASYQCFNVTIVSTQYYANYVIREFIVKKLSKPPGKPRRVWQYHYTEWPDFGVPRDAVSVLTFILHTREHEKESNAPPILHCSAGVGRTGTFIVLDAQMRRYDHRQDIEIYNFLKKIRLQRNYLVQQESQYRFIHDALFEYMCAGNTRIPIADLETTMNQDYWIGNEDKESRLTKEWKLHETMVTSQSPYGLRLCNRPKNRDQRVLPAENHRVRLSMIAGVEGTDYINASYVDSFYTKRTYILTQAPMENTVEDFWRMVLENRVPIIVDLLTNEEMKDEDVVPYLPVNIEMSEAYGKFEAKVSAVEEFDNFTKRTVQLNNSEDAEQSLEIIHYNYFNWSPDVFPRSAFLFDFMFDVLKDKDGIEEHGVVAHHHDRPMTKMAIHCRYGKGRSGLLAALFNLKEQVEDISGQVDVFSTVRTLLSQRPGVMATEEEYDFLYKATVGLKQYVARKNSSVEKK